LDGGRYLVAAARANGVRRLVFASGAYFYAPGEGLADEAESFAVEATSGVAASARLLQDIETQVLDVSDIGGVALRYGFFYGPGTWYWPDGDMAAQVRDRQYPIRGEGRGVWSFVHVDDAADATACAVESENIDRVYNVTDDEPSELRTFLPAFARWVGAPEPPHVPGQQDSDNEYYANELRGASNARAKHDLHFRPRRAPWFSNSSS
jgi:nucleoside-diphosphate-sugar epimerase